MLSRTILGEHYSEVITIRTGAFPVVGIVGLTHGDEIVGRKVLNRLQSELPPLLQEGQVKLIYANLPAEAAETPFIDANLNRIFPGKREGKLEQKIAYHLRDTLADCHFVIDIHSTMLEQGTFAVTTVDPTKFEVTDATRKLYEESGLSPETRRPFEADILYGLVRDTGLARHVQMNHTVANGGSLIEFVNAYSQGYGLSFEAGQHQDPASEEVAMKVVFNFLQARRMIPGEPYRQEQEVFLGQEFIPKPSDTFFPSPELRNFEMLPAGKSYGRDETQEYSLNRDCYVLLHAPRMRDGKVFLRADKIS